jgi:CRISPR-associated protein (TIGR03986 family)
MSLYIEPNRDGKLSIDDGKFIVHYKLKQKDKQKPVPDSAREFNPEDATDGAEVKFSMNGKGEIVAAYIVGKHRNKGKGYTVDKRPAPGQDRAPARGGRPDGRGDKREVRQEGPPVYGATAPYNFVHCPQPVLADRWLDAAAPRYSGALDARLAAETPLLVSGVGLAADDDTQNKEPRTFRRQGDNYVIPGSSIKGLLRSTFEIVTASALRPVSSKRIPYRDVSNKDFYQEVMVERLQREGKAEAFASRSQAGFLVRRGKAYSIIPCSYAKIPHDLIFEHFQMGKDRDMWVKGYKKGRHTIPPSAAEKYDHLLEKVGRDAKKLKPHVLVSPEQDWSPGDGKKDNRNKRENFLFHYAKAAFPEQQNKVTKRWTKVSNVDAWLVFSGWMAKKYTEFAFYNPEQQHTKPVPRQVYQAFEDQITPKQKAHRKKLEKLASKGLYPDRGIPVFYLQDDQGEITDLGLTQLFRIPARHSPASLVGVPDDFADLATMVFGSTSNAGRVFMRSATSVSHNGEDRVHTTVLGQPHASCAAHYLFKSSGDVFKPGRSGHGGRKNDANDLHGWNAEDANVRGWKRYWHRPDAADKVPPPNDNPDTQAHLKPLKPGAVFTTRIEFRDLTAVELGALLYAINPGEDPDKPSYHKLGMGKALGWGSVTVEVTGFEAWQPATRYRSIVSRFTGDAGGEAIIQAEAREAFKAQLSKLFPDGTPHLDDLRKMMDFKHAQDWGSQWTERTRPLTLAEFKPKALLSSVAAVHEGREGA